MIIENLPDALLDLHHSWHMPAHPGHPSSRAHPKGQAGGGLEFLQFHHDFVVAFHQWYDAQPGADQQAVAPWPAIPAELKTPGAGWEQAWADAVRRIIGNDPAFSTADELGTFIETGIHDLFLHPAAALVFNEPVLNTMYSPLSTHFYCLHGLIESWWAQWEQKSAAQGLSVTIKTNPFKFSPAAQRTREIVLDIERLRAEDKS